MKLVRVQRDMIGDIVFGAGVILDDFDLDDPVVKDEDIISATSGGITINITPMTVDLSGEIMNAHANTMQFTKIDYFNVSISFTALQMNEKSLRLALIKNGDPSRSDWKEPSKDFQRRRSIWFVGETLEHEPIAVEVLNPFNAAGFGMTTAKNGKATMNYMITGMYDADHYDTEPVRVYKGIDESNLLDVGKYGIMTMF